ncbi:MAG: cation transporter [Phycisphaerales bacterium]|nr:MAG: cation transporter [Phycisphaerales bacterium]
MSTATLQRNTLVGLAASVALAAGKLVAGLLGHSSALVADAVESLADSVGSSIVWFGLRVGSRRPDERYPYGYGRAEAIAAIAVGLLLVLAAIVIAVRAASQLLTPHTPPAPWTLAVLIVVIVVKEALFRLIVRGADTFESDAARADAWHHRSDAITSAAAFFGILIAVVGPSLLDAPRLVLADEVAAIFAALIILWTAYRLITPNLRELLDADSPSIASKVEHIAAKSDGVRLIEKVHARKSGRGFLIDMHIHVEPNATVQEGHAIAGRVKASIREAIPAVFHVLVHVEPAVPRPDNHL